MRNTAIRICVATSLGLVLVLSVCGCSRSPQKSTAVRVENKPAVIAKGAHYPDLPSTISLLGTDGLSLLLEAKNRSEIVAWAEQHRRDQRLQSLWTAKPSAMWFMVMHIYTSGAQAWMVYLYVYYPVGQDDPKPWKLMYLGSEGLRTDHLDDIACAYIDVDRKSLVFIGAKGNEVHTINIESELDRLAARDY